MAAKTPIPDLERNKFIEVDDLTSIVRVTQADGSEILLAAGSIVEVLKLDRIGMLLESMLEEQKKTNLLLMELMEEEDGC
jgi:hypothetical protein